MLESFYYMIKEDLEAKMIYYKRLRDHPKLSVTKRAKYKSLYDIEETKYNDLITKWKGKFDA